MGSCSFHPSRHHRLQNWIWHLTSIDHGHGGEEVYSGLHKVQKSGCNIRYVLPSLQKICFSIQLFHQNFKLFPKTFRHFLYCRQISSSEHPSFYVEFRSNGCNIQLFLYSYVPLVDILVLHTGQKNESDITPFCTVCKLSFDFHPRPASIAQKVYTISIFSLLYARFIVDLLVLHAMLKNLWDIPFSSMYAYSAVVDIHVLNIVQENCMQHPFLFIAFRFSSSWHCRSAYNAKLVEVNIHFRPCRYWQTLSFHYIWARWPSFSISHSFVGPGLAFTMLPFLILKRCFRLVIMERNVLSILSYYVLLPL